MRSMLAAAVGVFAVLSMAGAGCGKDERPPAYRSNSKAGASSVDAGISIPIDPDDASTPPSPDAQGLCGNQFLPIVTRRNNLYLVLDRSGSMQDLMPDPATKRAVSKYSAAYSAIHDVLFSLGHRLSYGAAVFPRFGVVDSCDAGGEVYAVATGDSVTAALAGEDGPNLTRLMKVLGSYTPKGATPTSATLAKLVPSLIALADEGKTTGAQTSVVLATDGAPNCNDAASCDAEHCIANIEHWPISDTANCSDKFNCCDASLYGPGNCIDGDATVAPIAELFAHGIKTYVIGLPGSEAYDELLNRTAVTGGTARARATATDPVYYPVTDAAELTKSLKGITASLAISCTITLDSAPPEWTQVNVYFDRQLVKMSVDHGWKQVDASTIEITGDYCSVLRSGDVFEVQVVAGCATEVLL